MPTNAQLLQTAVDHVQSAAPAAVADGFAALAHHLCRWEAALESTRVQVPERLRQGCVDLLSGAQLGMLQKNVDVELSDSYLTLRYAALQICGLASPIGDGEPCSPRRLRQLIWQRVLRPLRRDLCDRLGGFRRRLQLADAAAAAAMTEDLRSRSGCERLLRQGRQELQALERLLTDPAAAVQPLPAALRTPEPTALLPELREQALELNEQIQAIREELIFSSPARQRANAAAERPLTTVAQGDGLWPPNVGSPRRSPPPPDPNSWLFAEIEAGMRVLRRSPR